MKEGRKEGRNIEGRKEGRWSGDNIMEMELGSDKSCPEGRKEDEGRKEGR